MTGDPKSAVLGGCKSVQGHAFRRFRRDRVERGINAIPCVTKSVSESSVHVTDFWRPLEEPRETDGSRLQVVHPILRVMGAAKCKNDECVSASCKAKQIGEGLSEIDPLKAGETKLLR